MSRLKNGSNKNYLNSIMYKYNQGKLKQATAKKQWSALLQKEKKTIQKNSSQYKKKINQVEESYENRYSKAKI